MKSRFRNPCRYWPKLIYKNTIDIVEFKSNLVRVERTIVMKPQSNELKPTTKVGSEEWLETVRRQVSSLRFGAVQIVVHDSRVVQIEKTERMRFDVPST